MRSMKTRQMLMINNDLFFYSGFLYAHRPPQKSVGRPSTPKLLKSPGAEDPGNIRPLRITPESPQPTRNQAEEEEEEEQVLSPPLPRPQPVGQNKPINEQTPAAASGQSILSSTKCCYHNYAYYPLVTSFTMPFRKHKQFSSPKALNRHHRSRGGQSYNGREPSAGTRAEGEGGRGAEAAGGAGEVC